MSSPDRIRITLEIRPADDPIESAARMLAAADRLITEASIADAALPTDGWQQAAAIIRRAADACMVQLRITELERQMRDLESDRRRRTVDRWLATGSGDHQEGGR